MSESWNSQFLDLKSGVRLHFVEQGPKDGQVIILCHGWPDFWYGWRKQIPFLASLGYRVIAPDLRGFGQTKFLPHLPNVRESYTFKQVGSDLMCLLDELGVADCILIGHDWGGALVWNAARRFPSRVRGVGAICTPYRPWTTSLKPLKEIVQVMPVFYYQHHFAEKRMEAAKELETDLYRTFKCIFRTAKKEDHVGTWMLPGSKSFLAGYPLDPPLSPLLSPQELQAYVNAYKESGFANPLHWYGTTELNWREDKEDKLSPQVTQPALMVTCGEDRVLRPEMTIGMENWVPKLTRGHIEEASHWVCKEQADELNEILKKWLLSLDDKQPAPPVTSQTRTRLLQSKL